jgi:hypothetical protein
MNPDSLPTWAFFVGTILLVMLSTEVGYALGNLARRRKEEEKEAPISGVSGAILGLAAFMLAFTFGAVTDRYDARKSLVREDANAIRTAYLRADFLPEPDRTESKRLLKAYLDLRVAFVEAGSIEHIRPRLLETNRLQRRLWDIAVANARKDMNSDVAALYIESLNEMVAVHASRLAIGVQARLPIGIWIVLCGLTTFGMMSMGYHAGVVESKRSKATVVLAISFAMVIAVISSLDRPGGFIKVTQQPLVDLQGTMSTGD